MDTSLRAKRRHKVWPEALKREIVAACLVPGASVSMVARQYDANPARHAPGQRNSRRAVCGPVLHYDSDRAATSRERMTASKQGQHQMAQDPLAGDAGSTYAPLTPVPDARRAFRTGDAFALWFSLGIGLSIATTRI